MRRMSDFTALCAIIICYMVHIDCQSIDLCANPASGQSCALTCNTADFSQTVQFLLGGTVQGSCTVVAGFSACGPSLSQSGTITTYTIAALSRGTHGGDWSCKYGAATSSTKSLVVNTVPSTVEVTQTTPLVNLTDQITEVNVSAECYCIFPSTSTVNIIYKDGVSGNVIGSENVPQSSLTVTQNPGSPCLSDEFKIEVSNYVANKNSIASGQNVYLQVQFGSYNTADYGFFNFKGPTTISVSESSTTEMKTISSSPNSAELTSGATSDSAETSENTITKLSTVSASTTTEWYSTTEQFSTSATTERSGLSEELRNIVIIVSSVGGTVLIVVVVIVIVLCCKKRSNGKKTGEKHLKKQEFKPDVNYNLHNAKKTQSKQAPMQYNYKKNEKANNEMYNLNAHDYVYPNHPGYDYIYTNDRGYGGRKVPFSDGRHNLHYDPYRRNNYSREMPHSVPYSGYRSPVQYNSRYGSPVQYNNMLRHDGHQYRRHQAHGGHADRFDPSDQSGSRYTRRQYDNNWDTLF